MTRSGSGSGEYLTARYLDDDGTVLLSGIQALVRWCGFHYFRCASTLQRDISRRVSFRLSQFQEASCQGKPRFPNSLFRRKQQWATKTTDHFIR
jgi:hypothetical protein